MQDLPLCFSLRLIIMIMIRFEVSELLAVAMGIATFQLMITRRQTRIIPFLEMTGVPFRYLNATNQHGRFSYVWIESSEIANMWMLYFHPNKTDYRSSNSIVKTIMMPRFNIWTMISWRNLKMTEFPKFNVKYGRIPKFIFNMQKIFD